MPKTRLTNYMRSQLNQLARELVTAPIEEAELTDAYQAASTLVRLTVEEALPPADMLVLKKYGCARVDDCIRLNLPAGGVVRFVFANETGPLVVYTVCGRVFNADNATAKVVNRWLAAVTAHEQAVGTKLMDYAALISASRYYEDVLNVWPEAERLRTKFGAGALSIFSADVVTRIKQDVASRKPETV